MLMPIILSERDLARLYSNPEAMDGLLDSIEDSMRAFNSGKVAGQVRLETSLIDSQKKYRITTSAVPGAGQGMRISALFRGAKDSYFILLFDGDSGDLLALVAGGALNVWRTGAPAGVASRYLAPKGADVLGLIGSGRQARGANFSHSPGIAVSKEGKSLQPNTSASAQLRQGNERV